MKKTGVKTAISGIIVWTAFVLLGGYVFQQIVADMEDSSRYQSILLAVVVGLIVAILIYHVVRMNRENKHYSKFESLFSELPNGISDLAIKASQFSESGQVAIYKNYFISNWEFDFIDLSDVQNVYYERSKAIKRRTGAVAGDKPQLVFLKKNGEKRIIKLMPFGYHDYMPEFFEAMSSKNPELTFGTPPTTFSSYLPVFLETR